MMVADDAVRLPKVAPPTALRIPVMVEEPVTERSEVVADIVLMPAKLEVEDAEMPCVKRMRVEVELAERPKVLLPVVQS